MNSSWIKPWDKLRDRATINKLLERPILLVTSGMDVRNHRISKIKQPQTIDEKQSAFFALDKRKQFLNSCIFCSWINSAYLIFRRIQNGAFHLNFVFKDSTSFNLKQGAQFFPWHKKCCWNSRVRTKKVI